MVEKPLTPTPSSTPIIAPTAELPPQVISEAQPIMIKAAEEKRLNVAAIISQDIENHHIIYHKIKKLINDKKGTIKPFYLYRQNVSEIIEQIKTAQHQQVVAIGLAAAKSAAQLIQIPVIFCQVYNYQDHGLVNEYIKGVSLIPSVNQQLLIWKAILPDLKQVGVITGSGNQPFIESTIKNALAHNIAITSRTVSNDKEMWAEFRRLTPQVDAFWLLPDNRILSKRTLRNIINYSSKHETPLFTINGLLLPAGAVISSTQIGDDIAGKVVSRLLSIKPDNTVPGSDVEALSLAHAFVNTQATKRLNLTIPAKNITLNFERWPSPEVNATLAQ